ncbi:hypothetical protein [Sphingomonas sp. DT-204]|uniref:hypothetical protein n=1 Tax=Sphingomonas sp. DT-204 TaxID=3396166 RepID=UPI003F1A970E
MFELAAFVIVYITICCLVIVGPTYLLARLGYAKTSFVVALVTASALTIDYIYNWDGISYPHWFLSGPTALFPLTILVAAGAVAIGFMACLKRL